MTSEENRWKKWMAEKRVFSTSRPTHIMRKGRAFRKKGLSPGGGKNYEGGRLRGKKKKAKLQRKDY